MVKVRDHVKYVLLPQLVMKEPCYECTVCKDPISAMDLVSHAEKQHWAYTIETVIPRSVYSRVFI